MKRVVSLDKKPKIPCIVLLRQAQGCIVGLLWQLQIYDSNENLCHGDVIKWKRFPRYWTFVRGIHRSPMNSPHKGQWRGALVFSLICVWINGWVNNRKAGDLRRYRAHYDVLPRQHRVTLSVSSDNYKYDSYENLSRYFILDTSY